MSEHATPQAALLGRSLRIKVLYLGLVLVLAALFGALLHFRWPSNAVFTTVEAGSVSLTLAGPGGVRLHGGELGTAEAPNRRLVLRNAEPMDPGLDEAAQGLGLPLDVEFPAARLGGLALRPGTRLVVQANGALGPVLDIRGSGSFVLDAAAGEALRVLGPEREATVVPDGPRRLTFAPAAAARPLRLEVWFPDREPAVLSMQADLPVRELRFGVETGADDLERRFRSSIRGGSIRVGTLGAEVKLREAEPLRIEELSGVVTRLVLHADHVRVDLVGTAGRVRTGPAGFERDLTPTILGFLAANEDLRPFWAMLAVLLGAGVFELMRNLLRWVARPR